MNQAAPQSSVPAGPQADIHPDGVVLHNQSTEFACPRCQQAMQIATMAQTQVCCCDQCGGFVIDSGSFGYLLKALRSGYRGIEDHPTPMDAAQLDVRVSCPACHRMMETHPYYGPGNEVIDTCMHCQLIWLDKGEFNKLVRAPGLRK